MGFRQGYVGPEIQFMLRKVFAQISVMSRLPEEKVIEVIIRNLQEKLGW